jgi:hypothetical protein
VINTIDPQFFIANIRNGYDERKARHADKSDKPITMAQEMYNLIMNSNQIVHNRGRALAYLGNAEKKRKQPGSYQKHQYELKVEDFGHAARLPQANPFLKRSAMPRYEEPIITNQMISSSQISKRRPDTQVLSQAYSNSKTGLQ